MNLFTVHKRLYDENAAIKDVLICRVIYVGFIISVLAIVENIIIGNKFISNIPLFILLFALLVSLYVIDEKRNFELAAIIVGLASSVVAFPSIFLTSGGTTGGAAIYYVLGIFYAFIMFSGIKMYIFLFIYIGMDLLTYYIAYAYPEYISNYMSGLDGFFDSIIAVVLVGVMVGSVTKYMISSYNKERLNAIQQKDEIASISDVKSTFFANMSHEIRTPINTICGLDEMILRDPDASAEIKENAATISNASHMLLSLINDILDLSKIESNKMKINPVSYNTKELFTEVIDIMKFRISEKGLNFYVDIDQNLPSGLYGDDNRIKQILINLLTNAVKYTQDGSITLHVRFESASLTHVNLKIMVEDTGIGIKAENISTLFDGFTRVESDETRTIEGTGLGLSICKQLAELMDAELTVDSIYKMGSKFSLNITQKITDAAPIGQINATSNSYSEYQNYKAIFEAPEARVLIVDDNDMNRAVATKLLRATKVQVDTARSGQEALNMTLRTQYNVILMDFLMPEMNGVEAIRQIRKQINGQCKQTPVIVLTADLSYVTGENFESYGFDEYVEKPFKGIELEEKLLKFLPREIIEAININTDDEKATVKIQDATNYIVKKKVIISTDCVADIPKKLLDQYDIHTMYLYIHTNGARFADTVELDSDNLNKIMTDKHVSAYLEAASVEDYESYFAKLLTQAESVIHISVGSLLGSGYSSAITAAKGFNHVQVTDSSVFSGGLAMLTIQSAYLAYYGTSSQEILKFIEGYKTKLCSVMLAPTAHRFYEMHQVSYFMDKAMEMTNGHVCLKSKGETMGFNGIYFGDINHARIRFLRNSLKRNFDKNYNFIYFTHAGISVDEQNMVIDEIKRITGVEEIIVSKCSVTNAIFSGIGTISISFVQK